MKRERLTLSAIAEMAGVNPSTVSRVLNRRPGSTISGPVREKILELCDRMNYRPNTAARSTATGKSFRAGLILGSIERDMSSPVLGMAVRGLCETLQENNYTLTLLWAEAPGEDRRSQVKKYLMSGVADGYILGVALVDTPIAKTIRALDRPIIYFSDCSARMPEGISGVRNNAENAYSAFWKSIPEAWHGRILYTGITDSRSKFDSVTAAAEKLGIPKDAVRRKSYSNSNAGFAFDRYNAGVFARNNMDLLKKQKLIWCASDLTALGIGEELKAAGLHPGEDVMLIGYDNFEGFPDFSGKPFLTTVDPRMGELGNAMGRLLLERTSGISDREKIVEINADPVYRSSFPVRST